jgi:hypothetical protein
MLADIRYYRGAARFPFYFNLDFAIDADCTIRGQERCLENQFVL